MKNKIKIFLLLAITATVIISCDDEDPIPNTSACFTFSPEENIQAGDTVFFTNCSEEALSYVWNFGDEETSTEAEPFHIFSEPGTYDIVLTATNGEVTNSLTQQVNIAADLGYIINYGSYSGDKTTITAFNKYASEVTNGFYKSVNGYDIISNVQYAYNYNGNIYFMGNNADEIFFVDNKTFKQTKNAINTDINKPRHCIGNGDYLYVSCWESDAIFNGDLTISYIAKVDLTTNQVVKKISVHGGPEGLEIVGDKLYAALTFKNNIAVVDLNTDEVSLIDTPARTTNFEKDNDNNLYVTLTRDWDDYVTQTGIGYLNTTTNELEAVYSLDGVGTSYDNVMVANTNFSKLYVMSSTFNTNDGGIAVFDVASKSFESNKIVDGVTAINGIDFYDNKLICFISESVTSNGKMITYSEDGTKLDEYETGIAPFMLLSTK